MSKIVKTQAEFDKALTDNVSEIYIQSSPDVWIKVIKTGSAHVVARGSAHVEARGSAHVEAWESAHVVARGSAHVVAWGSAHVEAWESAHVVAWGSAHVVARGSAHVEARGSAHVEAWGNSMIALTGKMITATAGQGVMVNLSNGAKCEGGIKNIIKPIADAKEWCEFYGAKVTRGIAILYKAVDNDFATSRSRAALITYSPGETPIAPDWDNGKEECGGGLHFTAHPVLAKRYNESATHFIACPVKLSEIVVHPNAEYPDKVKAPRVYKPCYEVDIYGEPIK